jgi:glycosyltransferase involved in cell wall biosynthesis
MTSPFFSIIIPVYQAEKYLHQCVDSVLSQSYTNYEIILVDDGSSDNSGKICDEYATQNERITVIHKDNGGASSARNSGLKACSTMQDFHYVMFMDSDDFWMDNGGLQKLVNKIIEYPNCDFYGFNCSYYYKQDDKYSKWVKFDKHITTPVDSNLAIHYLVASGTFPMSACSKVLSYDFLIRNNIEFEVGTIGEDIPWFINVLEYAKLCVFINFYFYGYRQQIQTSVTQSSGSKSFYDLFAILETEVATLESRKFLDDTKNDLLSFLAYEFCILLTLLSKLPRTERNAFRGKLYKYKWLLRYFTNPKVRKVHLLYKVIGLRATEYILTIYIRLR